MEWGDESTTCFIKAFGRKFTKYRLAGVDGAVTMEFRGAANENLKKRDVRHRRKRPRTLQKVAQSVCPSAPDCDKYQNVKIRKSKQTLFYHLEWD